MKNNNTDSASVAAAAPMIYDELCSDLIRHLFDINNGGMYTDANLWQTHNQGYAENCAFNYGFVNVGSNDALDKGWLPLKGDIIEYWQIPSENISCVELRANDSSYGIRQRLMDYAGKSYFDERELSYAEGYYLITWKDRARRGDEGAEVNDAYTVRVTIGDPCENEGVNDVSGELSSKSISDGIMDYKWTSRCLFLHLKRAEEFNSNQKNIWISFKNTHNGSFGTLITDVEVHPLAIECDDRIIPPHDNESAYNAALGYVDNRNTDSIAWIQAHGADDAPEMPDLRFSGVTTSEYSTKAKLVVEYNRPAIKNEPSHMIDINAAIRERDTLTFPWNGVKDVQYSWAISEDTEWLAEVAYGFFGGDATLYIDIYDSENNKVCQTIEYKFRIAGQNPEDDKCIQYFNAYLNEFYNEPINSAINGSQGIDATEALCSMAWCIPAIAKHETYGSGGEVTSYHPYSVQMTGVTPVFNQFYACGSKGTLILDRVGTPAHSDDNSGAGGYGICQVTGDAEYGKWIAIPRGQIWNWQENIQAGMAILLDKFNDGVRWMDRQMGSGNANAPVPNYLAQNTAERNRNYMKSNGKNIYYKGNPYSVIISENSDKKMSHLCALKAYNGRSKGNEETGPGYDEKANDYNHSFMFGKNLSGQYCEYDKEVTKKWYICRYNSDCIDYVDAILAQVDSIKISDTNPAK